MQIIIEKYTTIIIEKEPHSFIMNQRDVVPLNFASGTCTNGNQAILGFCQMVVGSLITASYIPTYSYPLLVLLLF
jgi:hypothetical protein